MKMKKNLIKFKKKFKKMMKKIKLLIKKKFIVLDKNLLQEILKKKIFKLKSLSQIGFLRKIKLEMEEHI